ncbi:MAG: hypothetical protein ACTSUB_08230 [Candidatus Thorarchaeota archaeon]
MIRLIGILTEGGVPVRINSYVETEGEMIIGALISAAKTLCEAMGSGEVRKLAFKDNTLIVTESKKGYTVVALVERAEDYMDSLIRIIAEDIDNSQISIADGSVSDIHMQIVTDILKLYIREHIEESLSEIISKSWPIITDAIRQDVDLKAIVDGIDKRMATSTLEVKWNELKVGSSPSLTDALNYSVVGNYDHACAASMDIDDDIARVFAIKMGALSHTMVNTSAPPITELQQIAEKISSDTIFTKLAKTLVSYLAKEIPGSEYTKSLEVAIEGFQFENDREHLLLSYLFVDVRISNYHKFAQRLIEYFENKSDVSKDYIYSIIDRGAIFTKLYSVSSYDDFKETIGFYKRRITKIKDDIKSVLKKRFVRKLLKSNEGAVRALQGSLQIQNYITLLTALAESPVLTISERKEVLGEVLDLYWEYFRKLLKMNGALFASTIDSVFQSVGVACSEYYLLSTGSERKQHLDRMREYLRDIVEIMTRECDKPFVRFSIFVVTNAVGPIINRAEQVWNEEVHLIYAAMKLLDLDETERLRDADPDSYVTNVNNTTASLTSIAARLLTGEERKQVLIDCVTMSLAAQEWFVSHGLVCRDDIVATTYHTSLIADLVDNAKFERVLKIIIALNRVAVQDPIKYDYELAAIGSTLIAMLSQGWKVLKNPRYQDMARDTLKMCVAAWRKYGFHEKADNIERHFKYI